MLETSFNHRTRKGILGTRMDYEFTGMECTSWSFPIGGLHCAFNRSIYKEEYFLHEISKPTVMYDFSIRYKYRQILKIG